jgi:hypothetical protein
MDTRNAIEQLDLAPGIDLWQRATAPVIVRSMVYYNRGCCKAWLLGVDAQPGLTEADAKEFLHDLAQAAKLQRIPLKYIEADFNPPAGKEADIAGVYAKGDRKLRERLDQVKKELKEGPTASPATFLKAIQAGWETFKSSRAR